MGETLKPWEKVSDPSYFRGVMRSMVGLGFGPKHEGKAHVRFGTTGIGHSPHYQIEANDGAKHCFSGRNHEDADEESFAEANLSEERFSYSEVQAMLERLINGVPR